MSNDIPLRERPALPRLVERGQDEPYYLYERRVAEIYLEFERNHRELSHSRPSMETSIIVNLLTSVEEGIRINVGLLSQIAELRRRLELDG